MAGDAAVRDAVPEDFTAPPLPDEPGVRVGGQHPLNQQWQVGGDAATVVSRAHQANIGLTVVSPLRGLMPRVRPIPPARSLPAARSSCRREFLPLKSVWKLVLPSLSLLSQPAIAVKR